jgi:hypothetical protein
MVPEIAPEVAANPPKLPPNFFNRIAKPTPWLAQIGQNSG